MKVAAQITVKGTLLDKSKINYVEGARVLSTGGTLALTDSMGRYAISVEPQDSIFFIYNNKPTQKFAVKDMPNPDKFDISLLIPVRGKYQALDEVTVFAKTHREDSLQNREDYKNLFGYQKPGIQTSITPGGGVGMDLDAFINIFKFRQNKMKKSFQRHLEEEEKEKYVDYRFNKILVRRITQLQEPALAKFMLLYKPTYEFTQIADEMTFNQYILNSFYQYRRIFGLANKEADKN